MNLALAFELYCNYYQSLLALAASDEHIWNSLIYVFQYVQPFICTFFRVSLSYLLLS